MAKWKDHREAVRESLKRRNRSVYWLHAQLAGHLSRTLLYDYVNGKGGLSVENMQRVNEALGIRYTDE
jgi:hypothetical protein